MPDASIVVKATDRYSEAMKKMASVTKSFSKDVDALEDTLYALNKNKITLEGSNGTTIGNVAAGEVSATSMDAINGSQLYAVQQDIGNIHRDINKLGDEIDTVGALSAAMAGLHPRFQDGNKGELAMAYGGYWVFLKAAAKWATSASTLRWIALETVRQKHEI